MNPMMNQAKKSLHRAGLTKVKGAILASLLLGGGGLLLLVPQRAQANNEDQDASDHALLGTWSVHVSLDPATVPPGAVTEFTRIETYDAGGGIVASNNGPGAGVPPSQGNWSRVGHHEFAATELRLSFNAAQVFTGTTKIRSHLTLDKSGNEFTAQIQTDIFLPNGILVPAHPAGTSHGVRVPIEPLN
jgi:hypothetical protein